MFFKLLAAASVAVGLCLWVADEAAAKAKTNFNIGIDVGIGYGEPYEPYPPYYSYYNPGYYKYGYNYAYPSRSWGQGYYDPWPSRRISCSQAQRILKRSGYRRVDASNCTGKVYSFVGRKNGRSYLIRVSAKSGAVISRRPY